MGRTKQTYRKTSSPANRVTRRFSCTEGKSSKFWTITIRDLETSVSYGKIGSAGTSAKAKVHASEAAAQAEVDRLVREKLAGGYREEVAEDDDGDGDGHDEKVSGDDNEDGDDAPNASSSSAKRSRLNVKGKASTTAPTAAKYISIGYDEFDVKNPFDDEDGDEFQNGVPIRPKKAHRLLAIGDIVDFSPDDDDGGNCLFVGPGHVWLSGNHSHNREALTVPLAISSRFADAVAHYAGVMHDRSECIFFLCARDAWIRKQFDDASAADDLDPAWTFEVQFEQFSSLAGVSVVSRGWAEFSKMRQDDDDDAGDVLATVDFRDRDDATGTNPIDSASTWVPLLVKKMTATK
jgi:predicted DNA-binding WGR domain protein